MEIEREIRVMQPDCNNCRWLNITEEEQQIVKHRSYANEHSCMYYGTRVIHRAHSHRHDPFIYPCDRCYNDNFIHYEHVLRNGAMNIEREIKLVNRIIKEAIVHGGDYGGPYYINELRLKSAITDWMEAKGLTEKYLIRSVDTEDGYTTIMQIVKPVTDDIDLHYGGPNG